MDVLPRADRPNSGIMPSSMLAAAHRSRPARTRASLSPDRGFTDARSRHLEQAKLGECRDAVVEADLLDDLSVPQSQDRGAGEGHLPASRRGQRADQEVLESRAGVRAAAFPLADDVVA